MPNSEAIAAAVAPVVDAIVSGANRFATELPTLVHTAQCAAQHFAPWMVEERWFRAAVEAAKNGSLRPRAMEDDTEGRASAQAYAVHSGVAVIPMAGPIMKAKSKYGGCSSIDVRRAIRKAVLDEQVDAILLHIDSPGGTVAGTADLAADVKAADARKPVYAHIDDLGASAAYWVASQARRITANPTGEVGSIGTMLVLADTSGAYAADGIKVHLVSTGKFKGAGADGIPVTDDHLAMFQAEVDDLNEHFIAGVVAGRNGKMTPAQVRAVADGRVHIAAKAKTLGLIDEVAPLEVAMSFILRDVADHLDGEEPLVVSNTASTAEVGGNNQQNKAPEDSPTLVEPPPAPHTENVMPEQGQTSTAVAPAQTPAAGTNVSQGNPNPPVDVTALHRQQTAEAIYAQGINKGKGDGRAEAVETLKRIAAVCPGDPQMALDAFIAGQTPEATKMAFDAAAKVKRDAEEAQAKLQAENARLENLLATGGHTGVLLNLAAWNDANAAPTEAALDDPAAMKAHAEQEWDYKPSVRGGFTSKERYVAYRVRELQGTISRQVGA